MYDQHYEWLRRQHLKRTGVMEMEQLARNAARNLPQHFLSNIEYFAKTDTGMIDDIPFSSTVPADEIRQLLKTDEAFLALFLFYVAQEAEEVEPF